jgi:poly(3-hydroxybutyrate) depolymerase
MPIKTVLIFLFLLFPFTVGADEKISKQKMESQGKQRIYYLYAPTTTKTAKSVPLVVLFHESSRNGISLVEEWRLLADKEGFIVVGPDSSGPGWRTPEDGPEFLHALVTSLLKKFSIDQGRIYLFGHSAGAVFALDMAMLDSEYFAAVAVHAGAWRTKREMAFIDRAKRKIPVKIIIGDLDTNFSLTSVRETESALRDRLIPLEVSVLKGHSHWYYDKAPEINKSAWDFLKQTSLPK